MTILGSPLLKDVHIGIPSSGGLWIWIFSLFYSSKLVVIEIVIFCFQSQGVVFLWFKVLMSTTIIFKMALMTR